MPTVLGLTNDSKTTPRQSPAPPGTSNNRLASVNHDSPKNRLDTISKRNHAAAREMEVLLWRALCDSPDAAREYMAEDCVMINPLFTHGDDRPVSKDTEPSIEDVLRGAERFTGFRIHGDPLVVEIGLMAVASVYKITLYRESRKGNGATREIPATCSSSWRQTAGADWLLTSHHVAYAAPEEE